MPRHSTWWRNYFSSLYGQLYRGALAPELNTREETETLGRLFAGARTPVLDVGCGYGRHLGPLRRAGIPVAGVDYSMELLRQAPGHKSTRLVRGDMRRLPFRDASLGGAYMLFNSFGYFDEEENLGVLRELARVLPAGARLVADLPLRQGMRQAVSGMPPVERHQRGVAIYEAWTYEEENKRLRARGSWEVGGRQQSWELSIRLYTPAEFQRLLRRGGFSGEVEMRPLEDLRLLGSGQPSEDFRSGAWRHATNAAVLAVR